MFRRILVGLDGSEAAEAIVPFVGSMAKELHAEVVLLHVCVPAGNWGILAQPAAYPVYGQSNPFAGLYLERLEQSLRMNDITTRHAVVTGEPVTEILRYARRAGVDLIVLGSHDRSGPPWWREDGIKARVLQADATPVLVVHPRYAEQAARGALRNILVPLDGSLEAEAALPAAEQLAAALHATLTLLYVVWPLDLSPHPQGWSHATRIAADATPPYSAAAGESYLRATGGALRHRNPELHVRGMVCAGDAPAEIAGVAQMDTGTLVVMATHGRTGAARLLFGSVAERVMAEGAAPVLAVRTSNVFSFFHV
jgi:nucleotide-binding universal stress UspA family protein